MEIKDVIGIDVSKLTWDCCAHRNGAQKKFRNGPKGIQRMMEWSFTKGIPDKERLLFVFEHTGLYSEQLLEQLDRADCHIHVVPGLEIKRSLGITRGKDDRADARRIALYGYRKREEIRPLQVPRPVLSKLKRLMSMRRKLVVQRAGHMATIKEQKRVLSDGALLFWIQEDVIKLLGWRIDDLEREMAKLIREDGELDRMFRFLVGIKGIGAVTARFPIVHTLGFTAFETWRKFASYCGIAPFPHTSGTSVRGRTKAGRLANLEGKTLLHQCALSAVKCSPEMKSYYERRPGMGKSKMSTLNVVRNKLPARAFAVVTRGTPYVDTMKYAS